MSMLAGIICRYMKRKRKNYMNELGLVTARKAKQAARMEIKNRHETFPV